MKYTFLTYCLSLLVLSTLPVSQVFGQQLYQIKGATVIIELDYGDSVVQLQSKHLHVQLDNDNAEFSSKLKLATIVNTQSGFGSIIKYSAEGEEVKMTGKFKIDHIETSNHAVLNFEFSGMLTQNNLAIPIYGLAELQHVGGGGSISCMLGYSFKINQETLRLNKMGNPHLKKVRVQVLQTILNKNYN